MDQVRKIKPAIVVMDSFRVFDDLARSKEELRKFGYELAVNLMAWEVTTFLLGEYGPLDISTNPLYLGDRRPVPGHAARTVRRAAAVHPAREALWHRTQPRRALLRHHLEGRRGVRPPSHCPARGPGTRRGALQDRHLEARRAAGGGNSPRLESAHRWGGGDGQDGTAARVPLPRGPSGREGHHLLVRGDQGEVVGDRSRPRLGARARDRARHG